jgi:hypothetical protein
MNLFIVQHYDDDFSILVVAKDDTHAISLVMKWQTGRKTDPSKFHVALRDNLKSINRLIKRKIGGVVYSSNWSEYGICNRCAGIITTICFHGKCS